MHQQLDQPETGLAWQQTSLRDRLGKVN